jgi:hypothetical protein
MFRLAIRLLRTGINFVKAGGKDPGTLLDLNSTERSILEQALDRTPGTHHPRAALEGLEF